MTASVLDRERTAQYGLTIRCQDGGGVRSAVGMSGSGFGRVSRVTEKSLQVSVVDVNDNSPVFSQLSYQGTIIENNYIGLSVLQVSDADNTGMLCGTYVPGILIPHFILLQILGRQCNFGFHA